MKVTNKDTHTLCPAGDRSFLPLAKGQKVQYNGKTLTVKGSTPFMAWFDEKGGLHVPNASKATPVEIDITIGEVPEAA